MDFRARSSDDQWTTWLCTALLVVTAYVAVSRLFFGSLEWILRAPHWQFVGLPSLALLAIFFWLTRWDGVVRTKKPRVPRRRTPGDVVADSQEVDARPDVARRRRKASSLSPVRAPAADFTAGEWRQKTDGYCSPGRAGEDLFLEARNLPHQLVPDFDLDGEYLDLLGKSAARGYPPALAKLGEYAVRRLAWVEAYYWMWQADRKGFPGLAAALREIRKNWAMDGFPGQQQEGNRLFSVRDFSIGLALLNLDSGRDAASARAFLKQQGVGLSTGGGHDDD